jgi:small subunit ribosomal protein S1
MVPLAAINPSWNSIIMSDTQEKPDPATTPTASTPVESTPAEPTPTPEGAPGAAVPSDNLTAAGAEAKPADAKTDARAKRRPGGAGGGGGMPRRRVREPMANLSEDFSRFESGPKMSDLDAEIAGELEAALGSLGKDFMGSDTSAGVRKQTAAAPDHGRKKGKVLSVHGKDVFVEIPGGRSQGVLALEHFPEGRPTPGMEVEVSIEGYDPANGLLILSRKGAAVHADWSTVAEGMVVEARVLETNKGGLAVDINGIRGFMPISQIDLYRVEKPEDYVNQRLLCMVTQAEPEQRNLVVSRRAVLEKEREEKREKLWTELAVGQVRAGVVRLVKDFGAFVDLGGVDGLLPISQMSWQRVNDPTKIVQPGQTIRVAITHLDPEARKVSLSLKQLEASPWDDIDQKYPVGAVVAGKVTRTMDFGAFVELEPAIEGLVHISELAKQRVWRVSDVVKVDQEVNVKVLSVDKEARKLSLSIRQALAQEPAAKPVEEPVEEDAVPEKVRPQKPRTTPLRGGIGGAGSGLLIPPKEEGK